MRLDEPELPDFGVRPAGQLTESGWLSSYQVLLNTCCVKCGVWIGKSESGRWVEFDALPHRCTPQQARNQRGPLL